MNKKMRELAAEIVKLTNQAKSFMDGENKNLEEAEKLMNKVDELQKEYDMEKRIYDQEKMSADAGVPITSDNGSGMTAVKAFVSIVKSIIKGETPAADAVSMLVEGTGEDGGYTVPEEISTRIERYKDVSYALEKEIDVVPVRTNKGSRTFLKKGTTNQFVDTDENGTIDQQIAAPKFERCPWVIKDRTAFMPVSNDLIDDSDSNIVEFVTEWLGKAAVNTSNAKILAAIATKEQVELKNLKDINKAVTVTLGQAYKDTAKIYLNDDGLNWLSSLDDGIGRPLLNPDPTDATVMRIRCGNILVPIKVLPNETWPSSEDGKMPVVIGSLVDFVRKYDRRKMNIAASKTAVIGDFNAFAQNMTLFRAIERNDYRVKDSGSIVYGYISKA